MERYVKIVRSNFRYFLFPHSVAAIGWCIVSPMFLGTKNLDAVQTARIVELFLSLLGIILLVPLFMADEDKSIRDLCRSKREPMVLVHMIRLAEMLFLLLVLLMCYLGYLKMNQCDFSYGDYLYCAVSDAVFLGGIGVFVYGVTDLMPVGYMIPILYYILCYGGGEKYLNRFYLFSLMSHGIEHKIYLLISGSLLLFLGILFRNQHVSVRHRLQRRMYHLSSI